MAILKNRSHADGELSAAIAAFFQAVTLNTFWVLCGSLRTDTVQNIWRRHAAALRAYRAVPPKHRLNMGKRCGFVVHVFGGQDGHGGFLALYKESKPIGVVCQV